MSNQNQSSSIALPSELVDSIICASDKILSVQTALHSALQSQTNPQNLSNLRRLCASIDSASDHLNNALDGSIIDLDKFLEVKMKAGELSQLRLMHKIGLLRRNCSSNSNSNDATSAESVVSSLTAEMEEILCSTTHEEITASASVLSESSEDNHSHSPPPAEMEIYARTFPSAAASSKKHTGILKVIKVVTPGVKHDLVDLTRRRMKITPCTQKDIETEIIVIESSDDEEIQATSHDSNQEGEGGVTCSARRPMTRNHIASMYNN
jgi:hypothetical protein